MILRRLSPRGELILINLLCFGPFAVMSVAGAIHPEPHIIYDDRRLLTYSILELITGTLALLILRARGWNLRALNVRFTMPDTIAGVMLFIVANIAIYSLNQLFVFATGIRVPTVFPIAAASWPAVILILLVDPLFEETFEVAYNVEATERLGAARFGIALSAGIRLLCHVYHGPIAPLTILPLGIIFALVYWKWRRVWPLAVAHGVATFFALAPKGG